MSVEPSIETIEDRTGTTGRIPSYRSRDSVSVILGMLAFLCCLLMCATLGFRRIHSAPSWGAVMSRMESTIPYGAMVTLGKIPMASGHYLADADIRGHWTAFLFFDPACDACTEELEGLARDGQIRQCIHIVPIMTSRPLFVSDKITAKLFARGSKLPFDIGLDPRGDLASVFGATELVPYSVVVDPQERVRLATHNGSDVAKAISSFFTGSRNVAAPLSCWKRDEPYIGCNAIFTLSNGNKTSLQQLSDSQIVVLTFLTSTGDADTRRIRNVMQYVKAPRVRVLFVTSGLANDVAPELSKMGALVANTDTDALRLGFSDYSVDSGPVSIIVYKGRAVAGEVGAQPLGPEVFENALATTIFLSSSDRVVR